ncbi:Amidinotransferase [Necator americanus]|uniref:Amidinotransferase n=1 Tax=Necator americanus TaxID=51031 RepID=W2TYL8_NECAM|nr:Amidinotransferase [Necator americanus]ETN87170.1 Amidinotransferase [Necator americanus]
MNSVKYNSVKMASASAPIKEVAMAAKRILMCRPTYFQLTYSINPWMDMRKGVNRSKATEQWETVAETFPDMVFSANAAVIKGNRAYLANFAHPERKGESNPIHNTSLRAGDALWGGAGNRTLFTGVGPRTDVRALRDLTEKLDDGTSWKALGCRLVDPRFYHIDTAFCPLNEELAMYYPYAFDHISQHNMHNETDLLPVSDREARNFACNAVVVGRNVVMHHENDEIAGKLEKLGFSVKFVDMSEFIKSGGSAKCCTLAI